MLYYNVFLEGDATHTTKNTMKVDMVFIDISMFVSAFLSQSVKQSVIHKI